jgi:hypothetical protein
MSHKITVTTGSATDVPDGLYKVQVTNIEDGSGDYGDYYAFELEITDGPQKGDVIKAFAKAKLSTFESGMQSKLFEWVTTLNGAEPKVGEDLDLDDLVGKKCQVLVKDNKVTQLIAA